MFKVGARPRALSIDVLMWKGISPLLEELT